MPKNDYNSIFFPAFCKAHGLPLPVAEYQFAKHLKRKWRIDWYFEVNGKKVALEVEGGVWTSGRHTRGSGFIKDMEKYNTAATEGIFLLRVTPNDLCTLNTVKMIKQTLCIII
jgi:hypothetical protein